MARIPLVTAEQADHPIQQLKPPRFGPAHLVGLEPETSLEAAPGWRRLWHPGILRLDPEHPSRSLLLALSSSDHTSLSGIPQAGSVRDIGRP